jgi:hypothetical protein
MSLVYLVGSAHWDMKGPERLKKFLSYIRPDVIGLEASKIIINQVLSDRKAILTEIEKDEAFNRRTSLLYRAVSIPDPVYKPDLVLEFLANQNYEVWASYEHRTEINPTAEIYPIHDHLVLARRSPELTTEAFGIENFISGVGYTQNFLHELAKIGKDTVQDFVEKTYFNSDALAESLKDPMKLGIFREMDDAMEPKIKALLSGDAGTVVIVVGSAHLFGPYENNLYDRLHEFSPVRIRLPEVDKF